MCWSRSKEKDLGGAGVRVRARVSEFASQDTETVIAACSCNRDTHDWLFVNGIHYESVIDRQYV